MSYEKPIPRDLPIDYCPENYELVQRVQELFAKNDAVLHELFNKEIELDNERTREL